MAALIYLDTHVVAWLYAGRSELLSPLATELIGAEELLISPIVILELEYLHEIGRLSARGGAIARTLEGQLGVRVCDADFLGVVESASQQRWTRDPFDRVIVGHAARQRRPLLSKDDQILRHYRKARW